MYYRNAGIEDISAIADLQKKYHISTIRFCNHFFYRGTIEGTYRN